MIGIEFNRMQSLKSVIFQRITALSPCLQYEDESYLLEASIISVLINMFVNDLAFWHTIEMFDFVEGNCL